MKCDLSKITWDIEYGYKKDSKSTDIPKPKDYDTNTKDILNIKPINYDRSSESYLLQ